MNIMYMNVPCVEGACFGFKIIHIYMSIAILV